MSVINQMLNDLQQREQQKQQAQQLPGAAGASQGVVTQPPSGTRNLVLAVLLTLITCGAVFFIWQLNQENLALKQTLARQEPSVNKAPSANTVVIARAEPSANKGASTGEKPLTGKKSQEEKESLVRMQEKNTGEPLAGIKEEAKKETLQTVQTNKAIQPKEQVKDIPDAFVVADIVPVVTTAAQPSLAISRKQLSAAELVAQKTAQVQQAINSKQLSVAESLLEEILILQPENDQSRKQLAALWFGRQSYQAAINVLAQGISLAPDNSELRLMQAKIYLARGQKEKAYQVLQQLPARDNPDYQGTLANLAQQTGRYHQASDIYLALTRSQPGQSRWWLGLGVAYDSNGEFTLAVAAYRDALERGSLSVSSVQFARQRLQQLGG